jgi:taspase (threonine aspartase 1)
MKRDKVMYNDIRTKMFVCIHTGAGIHSTQKHEALKKLMKSSLLQACAQTNGMDAIVTVIRLLEDSELTNAGVGSCLNEDGYVECDVNKQNIYKQKISLQTFITK